MQILSFVALFQPFLRPFASWKERPTSDSRVTRSEKRRERESLSIPSSPPDPLIELKFFDWDRRRRADFTRSVNGNSWLTFFPPLSFFLSFFLSCSLLAKETDFLGWWARLHFGRKFYWPLRNRKRLDTCEPSQPTWLFNLWANSFRRVEKKKGKERERERRTVWWSGFNSSPIILRRFVFHRYLFEAKVNLDCR